VEFLLERISYKMDKLKQGVSMSLNLPSITGRTPRTMVFPYTMTARLAQFPFKWYWKNEWLMRYYAYAIVICIPVFFWIQKKSYAPANVALWKEKARKEAEHAKLGRQGIQNVHH